MTVQNIRFTKMREFIYHTFAEGGSASLNILQGMHADTFRHGIPPPSPDANKKYNSKIIMEPLTRKAGEVMLPSISFKSRGIQKSETAVRDEPSNSLFGMVPEILIDVQHPATLLTR